VKGWKETVLAQFKVLFQDLTGGLRKTMQTLNQDRQCHCSYFNQNLLNTEALSPEQTCAVVSVALGMNFMMYTP
jgi:hypothetical protein